MGGGGGGGKGCAKPFLHYASRTVSVRGGSGTSSAGSR